MTSREEEKDTQTGPNSVIQRFCDQFEIKDPILKLVNKTSLKLTSQFFDLIILVIFLFIIFYESGILKYELNTPAITLIMILFVAMIELIGAHTSLLKRFFINDEKAKYFFNNAPSMTYKQMEDYIENLYFSSKCINRLLKLLAQNPNYLPKEIIDRIISTQDLTKENLDLLFSPNIIKYIRTSMIMHILLQKQNKLTQENIQNIYNHYIDDRTMIKILIATQSDVNILLREGEHEDLSRYYTNFQVKKEQIDFWLKINPTFLYNNIRKYFSLFLYPVLFFILYDSFPVYSDIQNFIGKFIASIFGSFMLLALLNIFFLLIGKKLRERYLNRYIRNLQKVQ